MGWTTAAALASTLIAGGLGAAQATGALSPDQEPVAPPDPVTRDDPSIRDAARRRRAAAAAAAGLGKTRLTAGLGDTGGGSRRPTLLGEVRA